MAEDLPGAVSSRWNFVNLPHSWNAIDGQDGDNDYYRGQGYYAKYIDKAELPEADRYYLEIKGANSSADVYLDGEKLETYETLDALMAFDIEGEGNHLLELKYMPNEYVVGITISIIGILSFIAICAVDFVLKKTLLKNRIKVYEKDYFILDDIDSEYLPPIEEELESNRSGCDEEASNDNSEETPSDDEKNNETDET
jgi:hypothetical protein